MSTEQQPQGVTLAAFEEACQALGEEVVRGRMVAKRAASDVAALQAEIQRLAAERDDPGDPVAART